MVLGKGSIAERFIEYSQNDQFVIFASDHTSSDAQLLDLEQQLVLKTINENRDRFFVYFSSTVVYDEAEKNSTYALARLKVEKAIEEHSKNYLIIRVPLVVGRSAEDQTLLNHFVSSVLKNQSLEIWENAYRNVIDVDDLFFIADEILREQKFRNETINIGNTENVSVREILKCVERFLDKKSQNTTISKGSSYEIDLEKIKPLIFELGINFGPDYIDRLLVKYFNYHRGIVKKLSIVVPTYFAEEGIAEFYRRTKSILDQLKPHFSSEIIFVNDGSTDKTLPILIELAKNDPQVRVVNLSRNFGNQFAITAGIDRADGDALVIIDDDLQDPPETILSMLAIWENGFDVVYAVRRKRKAIGTFFALAAKAYYRIIDYLSEIKIPLDTGDFRLIDRKALNHLKLMREENRYFRGMVAWIGFKQYGLLYDRDGRFAGQSNFTLKKYFKFAFDGLTSFSEKPLYFSTLLGMGITAISLLFGLWIIYLKIVNPAFTIRGWASIVTIILFFGGVQLLSLGVIGLYIGKIYREVKGRPLYIVENEYGAKAKNQKESN